MKLKTTLAAAAAILTAFAATAQKPVATLKIWDNATAPHSNGIVPVPGEDDPARTTRTTEAELYIYPADTARATGQAVVICPGGSYLGLAIGHEGHDVARWLSQNGVTAAVLKYRMPNGHPEVPLEDVQQALRIMAGLEAGATGFSADKVGVMGFSAGGHLAATASTIGAFKPAFSILFYPVITAEQSEYYSLQNRVTEATPPTLLLHSDDDTGVPAVNSALYYEALKAHGVKASMHIYPTGEHGWGFHTNFPYHEVWKAAVLEWLREVNR